MNIEYLNKKRNKAFIIAILLSLLFHVLIIILFLMGFVLHPTREVENRKIKVSFQKRKPIRPPAKQPKPKPQPVPPKFFELVDNPNANQERPENASMLAEKSSVAAAPEAAERNQLAHTEPTRVNPSKDYTSPQQEKFSIEKESQAEGSNLKYVRNSSKGIFHKKFLGKPVHKPFSSEDVGTTNPSNKKSEIFDPRKIGKLALSTYAWDYAPYMKNWLRYLQNHWFAPPAYTELGLIQGQTIVRFRIYPDGHMEGLKVVYHEGHPSLKESSVSAVQASFPYKPLPDDFPDPYLEVTLRMMYPSLRRYVR